MNKFKKALLGIGTIATVVAPVAAVVSCGDAESTSRSGNVALSPSWKGINPIRGYTKEALTFATPVTDSTISFVSDGGDIKDKSFNQSVLEGMQLARGKHLGDAAIFTDHVQAPANPKDIGTSYNTAIGGGSNLIVAAGFNHGSAIAKTAQAKKDVKFIFVDGVATTGDNKILRGNVASVQFDMASPSFIMGLLAAKKAVSLNSSNPKVGIYGGAPIPSVNAYLSSFRQGVAYYNATTLHGEQVTLLNGGFVGNFKSGGKSKTISEKLVHDGANILLAVGGPQYKDAISAAKTNSSHKTMIIGVDVVTGGTNGVAFADKEYVFGSILKELTSVTKKIVLSAKEDPSTPNHVEYFGKIYEANIKNGGTGLSIGGIVANDADAIKAVLKTNLGVSAVTASGIYKYATRTW